MKFTHIALFGLAAAVASASPLPADMSPRNAWDDIKNFFKGGGDSDGQVTYYEGDINKGTCSFTGYTLPAGIFGSALSVNAWDDASNCGACVNIKGPTGSIKAMIVDQCPSCQENHIDLFQDAFSALASLATGLLNIKYEFVPCDISSPIVLKNKDGSSPYWFSMQVVNANIPVKTLEVSTDGGNTWQQTQREQYNFFNKDGGFGTDTVDVKVTSKTGKVLITKGVKVGSGVSHTAAENF
ncbi:hypothetical protein VTN00DRAFT_6015 [Thermoascus crustaceus]|uniref:uncharacterized protein n=1 Tax=Thermoascus crustaceus TaxID=5088 RepID=UPI00374225A9